MLCEGALAGALFGVLDARWAIQGTHPPLLSLSEWWSTWIVALVLGATWGLVAAFVLSLLARRATAAVHGLTVGLALSPLVFAAVFLRLRPHFGPEGRMATLALASGIATLSLALPVFLTPTLRRRFLLPLGLAAAFTATLSGVLEAPHATQDTSTKAEGNASSSPSLLLITLDTTRFDHLPPEAKFLDPEGFLEELDHKATRWTNLTAPIPLTGPSHSSLLTGLTPLEHGAQDNGWPIRPAVKTLAQRLRERGYRTAAILSSAVLHPDLCGLDRGFQVYDDSFRPAAPMRRLAVVASAERIARWLTRRSSGLSRQRRAQETVQNGLRFLRQRTSQPFFLWLHFYDAHAPYEPLGAPPTPGVLPALAREPELGEDSDYWQKRRAYAQEIVEVDQALTRLDRELARMGLLKQTLIVVVTDHGESFGTHGHGFRFDHGAYLYDDELHLAAWWLEPKTEERSPGIEAERNEGSQGPRSMARAVGMDSLGRALLARFSLRADSLDSRGFSLSHSSVANDTLWFDLRRPDSKLIAGRTPSGAILYEAYDLRNDPDETRNLLVDLKPPSQHDEAVLGSRDRLEWEEDETILSNYAQRILKSLEQPRPQLSESARARLKSLGYVR